MSRPRDSRPRQQKGPKADRHPAADPRIVAHVVSGIDMIRRESPLLAKQLGYTGERRLAPLRDADHRAWLERIAAEGERFKARAIAAEGERGRTLAIGTLGRLAAELRWFLEETRPSAKRNRRPGTGTLPVADVLALLDRHTIAASVRAVHKAYEKRGMRFSEAALREAVRKARQAPQRK